MSATDDTSRLFRAMGLERKAGDYKDLGQLTRNSRIAALDESALPMMAAVARSLDAGPAAPSRQAPVAEVPVSEVAAPAGPVSEALSPLMASMAPVAAHEPVAPAFEVVLVPVVAPVVVETVAAPAVATAEPVMAAPVVHPPVSAPHHPAAVAVSAPVKPAAADLSRVFERYGGKAGSAPDHSPPDPSPKGTPLKPLFDRLR
ncbi:hypothetical protein [Zavarzinia sp.]|uniref:hypothetical protein n=1 Tax=Zavarzinia sp. TaxID=2027920 RepID=UPI003BB7E39A